MKLVTKLCLCFAFIVLFAMTPTGEKEVVDYYGYTRDGGWKFVSKPDTVRWIRLVPNTGNRKKRGMVKMDSVYGVNHFFLDFDLTSGFVHRYSENFYKWALPDQFVLKYSPSNYDREKGTMRWVRKSSVLPTDTLGKNLAFFRQWKLSEIDWENQKVELKPCGFNSMCGCPQIKQESTSPFKKEFPIGDLNYRKGKKNLEKLQSLDLVSGGTVLFIWEKEGKVFFCDQHGSLSDIFKKAIEIQEKHQVDPTIAVGDAGPFCRKVKANKNHILNTTKIKALARGENFGAGFGYMVK